MLQVDVSLQRGDFRLEAAFTAPTPGVTALFGRSGCGKTTLVNLLAGLIRDGAGQIALDGEYWLQSEHGRRVAAEDRRIGYVFQDARLFPHLSVDANLAYGERLTRPEDRWIGRAEVIDLLGIGHLLDRAPATLSGGETRRVAIGRALLAAPRFLLLDEPFASLDAERGASLMELVERLRDELEVPILLVSHDRAEVARLAGEVVTMA